MLPFCSRCWYWRVSWSPRRSPPHGTIRPLGILSPSGRTSRPASLDFSTNGGFVAYPKSFRRPAGITGRRFILAASASVICAPVIVRAASLMPVRAVGPIGSQYHGRAERIFIHGHARRYGLEKTEPFLGEGRPLFNAVCK